MSILFQSMKDIHGATRNDIVQYTDEDGFVWSVPQGHRIWLEIYEPWLAAGNAPLPA